jgi:hypothetical protein
MKTLLWALGTVLLAVFVSGATVNLAVAWRFCSRGQRESLIPFLAGCAGAVGFLILPVNGLARWWWIPLVIDLGSAPMVIVALATLLRKAIDRGRSE